MQYRIVFNISATLILAPFTDYRNTLRSNCKRPRAWVYSYTALKLLERKCATCHATRKRSLDSASRVLRNTPGALRHPRYPLKFLITGKPKCPRGVTEHPIFNCAETNQDSQQTEKENVVVELEKTKAIRRQYTAKQMERVVILWLRSDCAVKSEFISTGSHCCSSHLSSAVLS